MTLRLLTFAALGSLFITLNIASTGCIGGASLSPSQLSGGADLSAANPDGSNKDKDKSGSDENAGSTTPPPGGGDGSSGSSTTGGDGGGSGGDVAKGTANFQPFESGAGEDKNPNPAENQNNENEDPAANGNTAENLEDANCAPNCGAGVNQFYQGRPADFLNGPLTVNPATLNDRDFH